MSAVTRRMRADMSTSCWLTSSDAHVSGESLTQIKSAAGGAMSEPMLPSRPRRAHRIALGRFRPSEASGLASRQGVLGFGQRAHEIGPADDADDPAVAKNRNALDAVRFERFRDYRDRRVLGD